MSYFIYMDAYDIQESVTLGVEFNASPLSYMDELPETTPKIIHSIVTAIIEESTYAAD